MQRPKRFLSWKMTRLAVCLGVAASMAVVLPTASTSVASAAPAAANHYRVGPGHGPKQDPGWGWVGWHRFRHGRNFVISGTVTGTVSSSGFQLALGLPLGLTTTSTTINVTVTEGVTFYREPGQSSPGINGVQVGDSVTVTGKAAGTGTLAAILVVVPLVSHTGTAESVGTSTFDLLVPNPWGPRGGPGGGPRAPMGHSWGPPPSLTSTSTTLTATTTTIDVTVTPDVTQYREPGQSSPGISGVQDGDSVTINGVQEGTDAVNALFVTVPLAKAAGTVSLLTTAGFTLTPASGPTITVSLSGNPKVTERGVSSPTLADGDQVQVTGTQAGGGAINATRIVIKDPPSNNNNQGGGPGNNQGGGPGFGRGHHRGR